MEGRGRELKEKREIGEQKRKRKRRGLKEERRMDKRKERSGEE